jgi:hypothetical protein
MAMSKLGGSPFVQPHQLDKYTRAGQQSRAPQRQQPQQPGTEPVERPQDQALISDKAKKLIELRATVEAGREAIAQAPDLRTDKVATVQDRLARGFYHSLEVHREVAGRVGAVIDKIDSL